MVMASSRSAEAARGRVWRGGAGRGGWPVGRGAGAGVQDFEFGGAVLAGQDGDGQGGVGGQVDGEGAQRDGVEPGGVGADLVGRGAAEDGPAGDGGHAVIPFPSGPGGGRVRGRQGCPPGALGWRPGLPRPLAWGASAACAVGAERIVMVTER